MTYNIRQGGAGREDALLAVIRPCDPDIVIFQEAKDPAVIRTLAQGAGMQHCAAMPKLSLGFMSRVPIASHSWHRPRVSRHAFLEIVPKDLPVRFFGVHLSAVFAALTERHRTFELRALIAAIQREQHGFHVVAGDFNTLAPGELLDFRALPQKVKATRWLSGGRVRWRTIQLMLDAGYADVFRARHPGDPGYTLPTSAPQVRLDYLFVPAPDLPRVPHCEVVCTPPAKEASDHCPLLADIDV
jgi:endonuclease/exonuclease/phosphatase family metal-dependent hydrolase